MHLLDTFSAIMFLNPITIFIFLIGGIILVVSGIAVLITGIKGIKNKKDHKISASSIVCTCAGIFLLILAIVMIVLSIRGMNLWFGLDFFHKKTSSSAVEYSQENALIFIIS